MAHIYKYPIRYEGLTTLNLPATRILSAMNSKDDLVIYAVIMPDLMLVPYEFYAAMTGRELPQNIHEFNFLNTVSLYNGNHIAHVYYRRVLDQQEKDLMDILNKIERDMNVEESIRELSVKEAE